MKPLRVRAKIWLEADGELLLGNGRERLRDGLNLAVDQKFMETFGPQEDLGGN